jgi:hypothetical protein
MLSYSTHENSKRVGQDKLVTDECTVTFPTEKSSIILHKNAVIYCPSAVLILVIQEK